MNYPQRIALNMWCGLWFYVTISVAMPKRTWQPKVKKGNRKHGFLKRMRTTSGRNILKRRRAKGRVRLAINRGRV